MKKEIYFKSFGWKDEDGRPAYICVGLALKYDESNKIISHVSTSNIYKNIDNTEEAFLVAGYDILKKVRDVRFVTEGETLSVCLTSPSLYNYYKQYYGGKTENLNQILSNKQNKRIEDFNDYLSAYKDDLEIGLNVMFGIREETSAFGIELLSNIEDEILNKIQSKVDSIYNRKTAKNKLLDAEIEELSVETDRIKTQIGYIDRYGNDLRTGTIHDQKLLDKGKTVLERNMEYIKANDIFKKYHNDMSLIPSYQRYF